MLAEKNNLEQDHGKHFSLGFEFDWIKTTLLKCIELHRPGLY